jgi:hypothetical protein
LTDTVKDEKSAEARLRLLEAKTATTIAVLQSLATMDTAAAEKRIADEKPKYEAEKKEISSPCLRRFSSKNPGIFSMAAAFLWVFCFALRQQSGGGKVCRTETERIHWHRRGK